MARLLAASLLSLVLAACAAKPPPEAPPEAIRPPAFALNPASFADLPGWQEDRMAEALPALRASCPRLLAQTSRPGPDGFTIFGPVAAWKPFCDGLAALAPGDDAGLRRLIEAEMRPVQVIGDGRPEGLFTGYYEPSLKGSRQRRPGYDVPVYGLPPDLVQVDLGQFRNDWRGQRTAGRVQNGFLRPYDDRAGIEAGKLEGKAPVLAWAANPVDVFFLQIQGSGRIELAEGGLLRVGFAGQNGHPYTAIGRVLIDRGLLAREDVTMPRLKQWLAENPAEAPGLLRENKSFVFFREISPPAPSNMAAPNIAGGGSQPDGPLGAQGLPLSPGRSLAVDRTHLAMGLPVWLSASRPDAASSAGPDVTLNRLMLAQDTGGAIRGAVRGDVFWGHGPEAEAIAGAMKHPGRYWLLLPKTVMAGQPAS